MLSVQARGDPRGADHLQDSLHDRGTMRYAHVLLECVWLVLGPRWRGDLPRHVGGEILTYRARDAFLDSE
jgi:hypothetical protein